MGYHQKGVEKDGSLRNHSKGLTEKGAIDMNSKQLIEKTEQFGANNYHPLPIVIEKAQGAWVTDPEGNQYLDMLSAYSALNQGHRHPKIIQALKDQADLVTLTSRAFHSTTLGVWYEKVAKITGKDMVLPMNKLLRQLKQQLRLRDAGAMR